MGFHLRARSMFYALLSAFAAILPLFALSVAAPARADAPEFLLGNLGVRVDLAPSRWHMTRWSDDDLEAKVESDPILLYVWHTPVRVPIEPADAWVSTYADKIEKLQGTDPKLANASVQKAGESQAAYVDMTFRLPKAGVIVLKGATIELEGRNLHIALVAPESHERAAARDRAVITAALDFKALPNPIPDPGFGGEVSADGVTVKLPDGWRPLQGDELSIVSPQLAKLGLEDLTGCWTAIAPYAGRTADVMASCSRPIHVGVVDAYSFAAAEQEVRTKLFGEKAPPGTQVDTPDRTGFLFAPRDGLAMGALPDGERVRVVWALGNGSLADPVRSVLQASVFPGPHAVTIGDQVSYYLHHRPFSPVVLCPIGCVCGFVAVIVAFVALIVLVRSRRRSHDDDEYDA